MDNDTNKPILPNLIDDVFNHTGQCVDNIFTKIWKMMKLNKLIEQAGRKK